MPDRTYSIIYKSDNTDALAKTEQLTAALLGLEVIVDRVRPKFVSFASGSGRSINASTRSVQGLSTALQQVQTRAGAAQAAFQGLGTASGDAAGQLTGGLQGFGATLVGLHEVRRVIQDIGDALREARDYAREAGESNLKMKDSLRESANLSGKPLPDQQVAASTVDLMLQSGFRTPDEALRFSNEFKGAFYAVRDKGHLVPTRGTPEQLERDIEVDAARLSAAKQVDPRIAAKLAASIGIGKPISSREQVGAEMGLTVQSLNEGIGSLSELGDQVLRARGALIASGYAQSVPDVAAMVSGMSINNPPGRTATRIESMVGALSKATAGKNAPELAKLGITAQNRDFLDNLRRLKPYIDQANQPGGVGAIAALAEVGIKDSRAQQEFIKSAGELPLYEKGITRNRAVLGDPTRGVPDDPTKVAVANRDLMGDLDKFRSEDSTGRFADARMFAANFLRGTRTERLQVLRRSAAADLIAGEQIKTAPAKLEAMLHEGFGLQTTLGGKTDEEMRIDNLVAKRLVERARKAGLTDKQILTAAPDVVSASSGDRGGNAFVGEERFGVNVQNLEDRIAGRRGVGPVIRDVMSRRNGKGIEERIQDLAGATVPARLPDGAVPDPGGRAAAIPTVASDRGDNVQREQLQVLKQIRDAQQRGSRAPAPAAPDPPSPPLGPAPVPGGPRRVGR